MLSTCQRSLMYTNYTKLHKHNSSSYSFINSTLSFFFLASTWPVRGSRFTTIPSFCSLFMLVPKLQWNENQIAKYFYTVPFYIDSYNKESTNISSMSSNTSTIELQKNFTSANELKSHAPSLQSWHYTMSNIQRAGGLAGSIYAVRSVIRSK
jgi:hypothetical protein